MQNLRDRDLEKEGLLIAEGAFLLERLLDSGWPVKRIWCTPAVCEKHDLSRFPCEIQSSEELSRTAGYNFHRGVLALAEVPVLSPLPERELPDEGILVLPRLGDPENLGGILRTALGLGIRTVFLGPGNPYVFGRKALRSAMGAQFKLNLYRFESPEELFARNTDTRQIIAAALALDAVSLKSFSPPEKWALLMGHEGHGLAQAYLDRADEKVIIPQSADVDSLNVNVAAGIILSRISKIHTKV